MGVNESVHVYRYTTRVWVYLRPHQAVQGIGEVGVTRQQTDGGVGRAAGTLSPCTQIKIGAWFQLIGQCSYRRVDSARRFNIGRVLVRNKPPCQGILRRAGLQTVHRKK